MSNTSTFYTLVRDSITGEAVYYLSGKRLFKPVVLRDDYVIPEKYLQSSTSSSTCPASLKTNFTDTATLDPPTDGEKLPDVSISSQTNQVIVDWDGDDDPENPYNWSIVKKAIITVQIAALTFSAYMASAIFTPAEGKMIEYFQTSEVKIMLGLTMFVWGYGLSPMFVSAMSESPMFGGRRYIFMVAEFLFVILQLPTALSTHVAPFVILRFLAGLCAGPPLSIGPAALGDIFTFPANAYVIVGWSLGAVIGPFCGPLFGAAVTNTGTWRWVFWFLMIQAGVVFAIMLVGLPETSTQALLMKKAKYLRQRTGNKSIVAPGDIKLKKVTLKGELKQMVWYPVELCLREPVLNLVNLHLTLIYAIIYLFFEAFPIVFQELYHFTLVELGCSYLSLMVGVFLAITFYCVYLHYNLIQPILSGNPKTPERSFGVPSLGASAFVPVGLFIFAWSSTSTSHWMGPIAGATIFQFGVFIMFQTYIAYIGALYPLRFASAVASNTVMRSVVGGAFPLFGRVFFTHTGSEKFPVGWGTSILAFACVAMVGLPIYFLLHGARLREKSRVKWGSPEDL